MVLSDKLEQKLDELKQQFPEGFSALLPSLHAVQAESGFIPPEMERAIAAKLAIPPERVHEAVTFYTMFHRRPVGRHEICVCGNLSCWLRGYEEIRQRLTERLGIGFGETTSGGEVTLTLAECLGMCDHAPVIQVNGEFHPDMTPEKIDLLLKTLLPEKADG